MFQIEIELQYFPILCPPFSPFQLPSLEKPSHTLSLKFIVVFFCDYICYTCMCMFIYAWIYAYEYINGTSAFVFVVVMYMVSRIATLQRATNKGAHAWEGLILFPSGCKSHLKFFLYKVGSLKSSPFHISMAVYLCYWSRLVFTAVSLRACSTADFLAFWFSASFRSLFFSVL